LVASDEGGEGLVLGYQGVAPIPVHRQRGDIVAAVGLQARYDQKVFIRLKAQEQRKSIMEVIYNVGYYQNGATK